MDFREVTSLVAIFEDRENERNALASSGCWGVGDSSIEEPEREENDDRDEDGRGASTVVLDGIFHEAEWDGSRLSLILS